MGPQIFSPEVREAHLVPEGQRAALRLQSLAQIPLPSWRERQTRPLAHAVEEHLVTLGRQRPVVAPEEKMMQDILALHMVLVFSLVPVDPLEEHFWSCPRVPMGRQAPSVPDESLTQLAPLEQVALLGLHLRRQ